MWKLTHNPNSAWELKIAAEFLYAEAAFTEERRKVGDFDTVDVKKQGSSCAGYAEVAPQLQDQRCITARISL